MTIKKKLVATTLSAALLFGSISVTSAFADPEPFINQSFLTRMKTIHDAMTATEKAAINSARSSIANADWDVILADVYSELGIAGDTTKKANFKSLIVAAANTLYDDDGTGIEALRDNPTYHTLLQSIATPAGVPELTVNDFVHFFDTTQTKLNSRLNSLTVSQIAQLAFDDDYRNDVAVEVIGDVLAVSNPLNTVFTFYFETEDRAILSELITDILGLPNVTNAALALFSAYKRVDGITGYIPGGSDPGTNPGTGTPGTGTPGTTPDPIAKVGETIKAIKDKIKDAAPGEKDELVRQAIADAKAALDAAGTFDLSKSVKVEGDKAVADISVEDFKKKIADLKKATDDLNATLKEIGSNAPDLKPPFKIDIGSTTPAGGKVNLPDDVLQEAKSAGFEEAELVINGASVTLPIDDFQQDTSLEVGVRPASELPVTIQAVTPIFSFNLSVAGQPVIDFKNAIFIQIPILQLPPIYNPELLTLFKIVDGKFQNVGGKYNNGIFSEKRTSFSSYVIVENKVAFNDTTNVKSWAGHQIDVMAAKGAIVGKSEGVFAPQDHVTRAEFVKMLVSLLELEVPSATESFSDVNATDWFAPYVAAAVKQGIVAGRTADKFEPNATINRAEMAAIITRALKITNNVETNVVDVDSALRIFSDAANIHPSLKANVAFAASKGLVVGNEGKFDPKSNATRAQAAVILYRAFNYAE